MGTKLALACFILFILCACGKQGPAGAAGADGKAGADGVNAATSAYTISSIADPCGDAPGIIDEVLLILANGQVLVSFSDNTNGKNTRFSILPPGRYTTTDGSNCTFTISAGGQVI